MRSSASRSVRGGADGLSAKNLSTSSRMAPSQNEPAAVTTDATANGAASRGRRSVQRDFRNCQAWTLAAGFSSAAESQRRDAAGLIGTVERRAERPRHERGIMRMRQRLPRVQRRQAIEQRGVAAPCGQPRDDRHQRAVEPRPSRQVRGGQRARRGQHGAVASRASEDVEHRGPQPLPVGRFAGRHPPSQPCGDRRERVRHPRLEPGPAPGPAPGGRR